LQAKRTIVVTWVYSASGQRYNNFTCLTLFFEYAVLRQFELICNLQADLLKIFGEKHVLYNFVGALAMGCSYLLVNKEYAKEILSEASEQKTSGNTKLISSCMNLLTVRCFS
jgi:hypothetical protein